jgi:hypothetical protein
VAAVPSILREGEATSPLLANMEQMGKSLIIIGAVIIALGLILTISGKLPWLGRLPGDIVVQKKNFTVYFPIATSIIISLLLTLVFWFVGRK